MNRRASQVAKTFEVKIEKLVYGGAGLARHEGKVIFVPFTAPGDSARVRLEREKKSYAFATVIELLEPGAGRTEPHCPYFGICGGCQWQHLDYPKQLEIKSEILRQIVHHRLPETRDLEIKVNGAPAPYGYRSRARLQLRGSGSNAVSGFYRAQSHQVVDIECCPLFLPLLNQALASVRAARKQQDSDPGAAEVEVACSSEDAAWSVSVVGQPGAGTAEPASREEVLLRRTVGEFEYLSSPSTFFQANDFLLRELLERVRALAGETPGREALDLYSGVGFLSLPLARRFESVTAVDSSRAASELCEQNARRAGFKNVKNVCAEVSGWMDAVGSVAPPSFDLVILDPPRAGAGTEVMNRLREWAPEAVIYVSCDPNTMVRDLALLPARDYRIDSVEGLDLFPQTYHFETIVSIRRR